MGNKIKTQIEGNRVYRLILDIGCHIDLKNFLPVHGYARNLVSVAKFEELNFNFMI